MHTDVFGICVLLIVLVSSNKQSLLGPSEIARVNLERHDNITASQGVLNGSIPQSLFYTCIDYCFIIQH